MKYLLILVLFASALFAQTFEFDGTKGSLLDQVSKTPGLLKPGNSRGFPIMEKGRAFEGDGIEAYIAYGDIQNVGTGDFSIELWFRLKPIGTEQRLIGKRAAEGWFIALSSSGLVSLAYADNTGGNIQTFPGSPDAADNAWHHLIINIDRDVGATAYLDTSDIGTITDITNYQGSWSGLGSLEVGRMGTFPVKGYISKASTYLGELLSESLRLENYNKFLNSYDEVENKRPVYSSTFKQRAYANATTQEQGKIADYYMFALSGAFPDRTLSGNDATIFGGIYYTANGMRFNGVNGYATNSKDNNNNLGSVQLTFLANANARRVMCGGFIDGNSIYLASNGQIGSGNSNTPTSATTTSGYGDGLWHTLTVVKNANNDYTFYVDGIDVSGGSNTGFRGCVKQNIGCAESSPGDQSLFWDGEINSIKVYDYQLTEKEAIEYHNFYATQKNLVETFTDGNASGIPYTPFGWRTGTGTYAVSQLSSPEGDLETGQKYLECTISGDISIHYIYTTQADARVDFYNGTSWESKSGTLADLISNNAWLSLSNDYLIFNLTAGQRFTNLILSKSIAQ